MENRLREERERKGLSQEEMGKILNVNQRAISHYENGKRDMGTETLNKLATFFNVSVDYLLGRTKERRGIVEKEINPRWYDKYESLNDDEKEDYDKERAEEGKRKIREYYGCPDIENTFLIQAIEKIKAAPSEDAAILSKLLDSNVDLKKVLLGLEAGYFRK